MLYSIDTRKKDHFRKGILNWGRKNYQNYSWRCYKNPFHILLAEILLRQTNAEKVQKFIIKIIPEISSPQKIIAIRNSKLESLIKPLGLQKKKRKELKQLAKSLISDQGGKVPRSYQKLTKLPGVGNYTANAVLCFGFGERRPLLDTNIMRIINRVFNISSNYSRPWKDTNMWEFVSSLLPIVKTKEFSYALLDFGKKICRARKPFCTSCLINKICDFYRKRNHEE